MDVAKFHRDYDYHPDDRIRLFGTVADFVGQASVLYPGSYVDIAPSVFFDDVTYVDTDKRAARFFDRADAVSDLIVGKRAPAKGSAPGPPRFRFHHADYREALPLEDASVGLLVSLYAGFISEHCTRYLAPGGWLLANNSHGDASMATLDSGYTLVAVVNSRSGAYRVSTTDLQSYFVPKKGQAPTKAGLHDTNRGIAYTKAPFAYLLQKSDT